MKTTAAAFYANSTSTLRKEKRKNYEVRGADCLATVIARTSELIGADRRL